ncbi:MAG: aminotransferase class V-fold PLP-dependent enzyme, partial [Desulfobacteraceae bacterium]|nr:aminotransferase class V-fold PLP-dependent enzyme [Desulfobacteraceae bacterium]
QAEKGRQLKQLFLDHETALLTTFLDWLKQRSDIRIIGPADPTLRAPTVSILPKDKPMDAVFAALTAKKIMAGQGHFYGVRPLMGMHLPIETGVLRLSFLHYTTADEIHQLIDGLSAALE